MTFQRIRFLVMLALLCWLAGCANLLPARRAPPAVPHDLGWLPAPPVVSLDEVPVVAVDAPPWLSEPALRYRRRTGFDDTALLRYPDDYWIAPPRFEQEQSGAQSESVVSLQARLLDPRNRRQFASPTIDARVADPLPGAAGAVRGLGKATDQAIAALMTWLADVELQNQASAPVPESAPSGSVNEGLRSLFPGSRPQR